MGPRGGERALWEPVTCRVPWRQGMAGARVEGSEVLQTRWTHRCHGGGHNQGRGGRGKGRGGGGGTGLPQARRFRVEGVRSEVRG